MSRSKEEAFISKGYRNWKDALSSFAIHARSPSHTFSVERVAHFHKAQPVNSQLASQLAGEQAEGRSALEIIFTSVQYLARQGLAFRGHTVDEGNFMQILKLRTRDNPKFHRWVDRKVDYTTPQAQNEILLQFSHAVVRQIAQDVKTNRIFSVIVDGTQDAGRKEQMSVCIRHVDDNFIPHEEFVGLYEPPNTTGLVPQLLIVSKMCYSVWIFRCRIYVDRHMMARVICPGLSTDVKQSFVRASH